MNKKCVLAKLLAITMLVSVATTGCSSQSNTSGTDGNSKNIQITGMLWKTEAQEGITALEKKFHEKYPNITASITISSSFDQTLQGRIASGNAPDLIGVRGGNYSHAIIKAGNVMELTDQSFLSNVKDDILSAEKVDGKVYSLPVDAAAEGIIYNKKVFSDLGITVPKTWKEFEAACDKIKAAGITPVALAGKDSWTLEQALIILATPTVYGSDSNFDLEVVKDGTKTYNDPLWQKTMKYYSEIRDNYANKDYNSLNYATANQMVASGKAAMVFQGLWDVSAIKEINADADLGLFLPPTTENPTMILGCDFALGVSSTTKNKDASLKFLEFLTTEDASNIWTDKVKTISCMKNSPMDFDSVVKDVQSLLDGGTKTYPLTNHMWYATNVDTDIGAYNSGSLSSDDTLKQIGEVIKSAYKSSQK